MPQNERLLNAAVVFDNFGPYHLARLNSLSIKFNAVGIEKRSVSNEYAWHRDDLRSKCDIVSLERTEDANLTLRDLFSRFKKLFIEYKIDVVAIPGWSGRISFAASMAADDLSIRQVLMSESTAHDHNRNTLKELLKRCFVRSFSAALVGGILHKSYLMQLGMSDRNIFFGYDVIDNEHFSRPSAPHEQLRPPYFLASARFVPKKNLVLLIRAYARYRQTTPQEKAWDLVLLGDGNLRPELQREIETWGLSDQVTMPGFVQYAALPTYYRNAAAFIHVSTTEQWGLVINEAMAAGLPVIASNRCGCIPELVMEGKNGLVVNPVQLDEIVEAMKKISVLPLEQLQEMGEHSRRIISEWPAERFADGFCAAAKAAFTPPPQRRSLLDRNLTRLMGALCK